jgi:murein DD-endopeptidase MepM/ murein hydrolase activator NlpD
LPNLSVDRLQGRRRPFFADRELTIRSGEQVRTLTLSKRKQLTVAIGAFAGASALALSLGAMAMEQQETEERMLARQAQVESEAARVAAFRSDLDTVAEDLQRRQAFLEKMVEMLPADVTEEDEPAGETANAAGETVARLGTALPEGAALARMEQRQLSLAERLTRFAEARAAGAERAIRKLGLDPRAVVASARTGLGGPLERLSLRGDSAVDRQFRKLGTSLARLDELENALARIPQVMPADGTMVSSSYGLRRDPFTGEAAMHSGLDFRGAIGAPIHAAAKGRVSFVGIKGGYGNAVEISHGNGLMTRYAHMSGFRARVGQEVAAGDVIGLIGSTGRSTGPHLHFEVRVNDRAVNPRPFLENAPQLLQQARETEG